MYKNEIKMFSERRIWIIFLIMVLLSLLDISNVSGQVTGKARIDSLRSELDERHHDSTKIDILNQLAYEYYMSDPDEGLKVSRDALVLSQQINDRKRIASSYNTLGINYSFGKSQFDTALKYHQLSLDISRDINFKKGLAQSNTNIGIIYANIGEYEKAIEYYQKSLEINKQLNDLRGITVTLGNLGVIYDYTANYNDALRTYQKAIKYAEDLGNEALIATNLINISLILINQAQYEKSINNLLDAEKILIALGDISNLGTIHLNLGLNYDKLDSNEKAENHYLKSIEFYSKVGSRIGLANTYMHIAGLYMENFESYEQAFEYNYKALYLNKEINNKRGISSNLGNIGTMYYNISTDTAVSKLKPYLKEEHLNSSINLDSAIQYLENSFKIAEHIGARNELMHTTKFLHKAYYQKGMFKKAYDNFTYFSDIQDSLYNIKKTKEIMNLQNEYENSIKDKEIKMLKESEKSKARVVNIILITSLIVIVLVALFTFVLYKRFKKEKTLTGQLNEMNATLEKHNDSILEKNEELETLNSELTDRNHEIAKQQEEVTSLNYDLSMINQRFQAVLEIMDHACIMTDSNNNLILYNRKAKELYPLLNSLTYNDEINFEYLINETDHQFKNQNRSNISAELIYHPDYKNYELSVGNSHYLVRHNPLNEGGFVRTYTNISDIKQKELQLENNAKELKRLNNTKDMFFSIIAHDLGNSFQFALTTSTIIANYFDEMDEEKRQETFSKLNKSIKESSDLFSNLLVWARKQTGTLKPYFADYNIKDIIKSAISPLMPNVAAKSIKLTIESNEDIKTKMDSHMVETIFRNLVNNAIKFTPENGTITIRYTREEGFIITSIQDSGIGMSQEKVRSLFKLEYARSTPGTNNERGTGLGLILCKEFIELHEGRILVDSVEGEGSTFYVELPVVLTNQSFDDQSYIKTTYNSLNAISSTK